VAFRTSDERLWRVETMPLEHLGAACARMGVGDARFAWVLTVD
jgi:hypothetical protein